MLISPDQNYATFRDSTTFILLNPVTIYVRSNAIIFYLISMIEVCTYYVMYVGVIKEICKVPPLLPRCKNSQGIKVTLCERTKNCNLDVFSSIFGELN
jgi:hypothetical protein